MQTLFHYFLWNIYSFTIKPVNAAMDRCTLLMWVLSLRVIVDCHSFIQMLLISFAVVAFTVDFETGKVNMLNSFEM